MKSHIAINRPLTEVQTLIGQTNETPGQPPIGTRYSPDGISEYIFLKGATGIAAGNWVTYNLNTFTAAKLAADAFGPVAVALAAVSVATYVGWFQIWGVPDATCLVSCAAGANLYATATAGAADDTAVAGDLIHNALCRETEPGTGTANIACEIYYPFVDNNVDDATA